MSPEGPSPTSSPAKVPGATQNRRPPPGGGLPEGVAGSPVVARLRRHDLPVVALLVGVLLLPFAWALRDFRGVDDAHITFVFARSFAEGRGLTWNGAPGLGTSSPFFAVVLGSLARVTGAEVPALGIVLGWVAVWAGAVALYALGRAEGWPRAGAAGALVWAAAGYRLHLGGEYLPAVALALLAAVAFRRGRALAAGCCLALAAMFRAEVGLAAPLLAAARVVQAGWRPGAREVLRAALAALAVTALWVLVLQALAGAVVPQTMEAKRAQAGSALRFWDPGPRLAQLWADPGSGFSSGAPWVFWVLAVLGVVVLARRARAAPFALVLVLWGIVHLLALHALGVAIYPWYATPVRLAAYLLACLAAEAPWLLPRRGRRALATAVGVLLALALAGQATILPALAWTPDGARAASYRAVGELADRYPPGTTLASIEVGFVGYYSRQPVLDVLGLVSPDVSLDAVRAGDLAANVRRLDPDLLMMPLASGSLYYSAMGEPRALLERYQLDHLVLATGFPVALYRRREIPALGEVGHDLLVRAASTGRVSRIGSEDGVSMLGLGVRGGDSAALSAPPGRWGGLRLATQGARAGARVEVVVRTPGGRREAWTFDAPAGAWRWQTTPPFETGRRARVVLRCLAPPEVACRFGQPHLLRP
jgi:hypothetical protein